MTWLMFIYHDGFREQKILLNFNHTLLKDLGIYTTWQDYVTVLLLMLSEREKWIRTL